MHEISSLISQLVDKEVLLALKGEYTNISPEKIGIIMNESFPSSESLVHLDEVLDDVDEIVKKLDHSLNTEMSHLYESNKKIENLDRGSPLLIQSLRNEYTSISSYSSEIKSTVDILGSELGDLLNARKNIVTTIGGLKSFGMLLQAMEQLREVAKERRYDAVDNLLDVVLDLSRKFTTEKEDALLRSSSADHDPGAPVVVQDDPIGELLSYIEGIRRELRYQITEDSLKTLFGSSLIDVLLVKREETPSYHADGSTDNASHVEGMEDRGVVLGQEQLKDAFSVMKRMGEDARLIRQIAEILLKDVVLPAVTHDLSESLGIILSATNFLGKVLNRNAIRLIPSKMDPEKNVVRLFLQRVRDSLRCVLESTFAHGVLKCIQKESVKETKEIIRRPDKEGIGSLLFNTYCAYTRLEHYYSRSLAHAGEETWNEIIGLVSDTVEPFLDSWAGEVHQDLSSSIHSMVGPCIENFLGKETDEPVFVYEGLLHFFRKVRGYITGCVNLTKKSSSYLLCLLVTETRRGIISVIGTLQTEYDSTRKSLTSTTDFKGLVRRMTSILGSGLYLARTIPLLKLEIEKYLPGQEIELLPESYILHLPDITDKVCEVLVKFVDTSYTDKIVMLLRKGSSAKNAHPLLASYGDDLRMQFSLIRSSLAKLQGSSVSRKILDSLETSLTAEISHELSGKQEAIGTNESIDAGMSHTTHYLDYVNDIVSSIEADIRELDMDNKEGEGGEVSTIARFSTLRKLLSSL